MKKIITKTIALTALILALTASQSFASGTNPIDSVGVNYVGTIHNKSVIKITINNGSHEMVEYTLSDSQGNTIYTEKFISNTYSKKFLLNVSDELLSEELTLTIKTYNPYKTTEYTFSPKLITSK
jgi:mannitol-1-phosphate/altronate dehydrogenase